MKAAVKQSAMPSSPTANQDFTDGVFSSDVKLMIPFFTRATANNTTADGAGSSFGATDGTGQAAIGHHSADALVTTSDVRTQAFTSNVATMADAVGNASIAEGSGSLLSTGGRIAWTDWNANELINALLIGGSDVSATVVSATLNGTTDVPVTHGLGATPDIIIGFTIARDTAGAGTNNYSIGFYDVVGNTYASLSKREAGSTTTSLVSYLSTTFLAAEISNSAVTWSVTVNDIGATTFDVVASAATPNAPTTAPVVYFICLKVTGGAYKVGTFLTKTSTGTQADITGMSAKPKLVMYLASDLLTSEIDTVVATNRGESFGFGAAVDNEGVTEQGSVAAWGNDAVVLGNPTPVTEENSRTSNTKAGMIFNGSGALDTDWSISSWDSGGITNNYSTASGTARLVAYLAIAPEGAAPLDPIVLRWSL